MTPEKIKSMINELFQRYESSFSDPEAVYEHFHNDGIWWVAGSTPMSGEMTKPQLLAAMKGFQQLADTGMRLTAKSFLVQGDKASVEAESSVKLKNGITFANQYHFLFEFRDDKIFRVKEYMDTKKVVDLMAAIGPKPA